MLKIKKIKTIFIIILILLLSTSFIKNYIQIYNSTGIQQLRNYSLEEVREKYNQMSVEEKQEEGIQFTENLSDEELKEFINKTVNKSLLFIFIIALIKTSFRNLFLIALFIIVKVVNKQLIKEKLNKDDFNREKQYYREIVEQTGMCEIALIDRFELKEEDLIAEILQLENKNIINVNDEGIKINKDYNNEKLKETQRYILENIKDGKISNINMYTLKNKAQKDALEDGLIEQKNDLGKIVKKKLIINFVIYVIILILQKAIFMIPNGGAITFALIAIFILLSVIYPFAITISIIITIVKYNLNPYFRTEKGEDLNKKIEGLKMFLKDYSLIKEQDKNAITVWEEYLVYSVLFGQNKIIEEEYKKHIN